MKEKLIEIDKLLDKFLDNLDFIYNYLKVKDFEQSIINNKITTINDNKDERNKCFNNFSQGRL